MEKYNCIWEAKASENKSDPGRNYYIFPEKTIEDIKDIIQQDGLKLDINKLPFTYIYPNKIGLSGGINGNNSWSHYRNVIGALNSWLENHENSFLQSEYDL